MTFGPCEVLLTNSLSQFQITLTEKIVTHKIKSANLIT